MRVVTALFVAILGVVTATRDLIAQNDPAPAEMVRVTVDSSTMRQLGQATPRFTGVVADTSATTIAVRLQNGSILSVPRDGVTLLEVSHATHSQVGKGARKGAAIGAGFGLLVGIVAVASSSGEDSFCCAYSPSVIPQAALGGALWGAVIGVIVGAVSRKPEWQAVGTRVGPSPSGVGISVRF